MNKLELERPLDPQEWLSQKKDRKLSLVDVKDLFDIYQQYEEYAEYVTNWKPYKAIAKDLVNYGGSYNTTVHNKALGVDQTFYVEWVDNKDDKTVEVFALHCNGKPLNEKHKMWFALCTELKYPTKPF